MHKKRTAKGKDAPEIISLGRYTPHIEETKKRIRRANIISRVIESNRSINQALTEDNINFIRHALSNADDEALYRFDMMMDRLFEAKKLLDSIIKSYTIF